MWSNSLSFVAEYDVSDDAVPMVSRKRGPLGVVVVDRFGEEFTEAFGRVQSRRKE